MVFYIIIVAGVVVFWEGKDLAQAQKIILKSCGSPWSGIRNSFGGAHCDTATKVAQASFVSETTNL